MEADRDGKASVAEQPIYVRFTPTIEQDYKRRNVFPTIRTEHAEGADNGAGAHRVQMGLAGELLADALKQCGGTERGMKKAYGAFRNALQ